MTVEESFGEHIRKLREENRLPLRKVAVVPDINPSTLSKIERGERSTNKESIPLLAELFKEDTETLGLILLSDVAYDLMQKENPNGILKVAEEKIRYLKSLKKMKEDELMNLWYAFTDIPIDEEECIDVDFHIWPKGTDRFEIWHWFDELFTNGIHEMLYNHISKTNHT